MIAIFQFQYKDPNMNSNCGSEILRLLYSYYTSTIYQSVYTI
jgi:hypothetical protein